MAETPGLVVIDVRRADEVNEGMVPGAVWLPLADLPASLALSPDDFEDKHSFPKPTADTPLCFYCKAGVRSASACNLAVSGGPGIPTYRHVINYVGSYDEYKSH